MWSPPGTSCRHVFFDCDATLSAIEGMDELARMKGRHTEIAELTRRAMDGEVRLEDVYALRLELLRPTRGDLERLAALYRDSAVPDAPGTVAALLAAGVEVHVVSGGLRQALLAYTARLGIPDRHVHAVDVEFDGDRYASLPPSPLARAHGKAGVVAAAAGGERRTMLVGDGITDLEARPAVGQFVGFGGVFRRERVAEEADVFVAGPGLAAVAPLALSAEDARRLDGTEHAAVIRRGLEDIRSGRVSFRTGTQPPPGEPCTGS